MTKEHWKNTACVCVLNDCDTWTGLSGCIISPVFCEEELQALEEEDIKPYQLTIKVDLLSLVEWAIDNGYFDGEGANGERNTCGGEGNDRADEQKEKD